MDKRKMGNEWVHFRSPNINVCFKAEIIGNFAEDDFRRAIDVISLRHPIVNCVVNLDDTGNAWYVLGKGTVGIEYYSNVSLTAWREWYEKIDGTPFDFEHGPLVKIGVFCNGNTTDIVIIGHHILGDGLGYLNLLKDILSSLDSRPNTIPLLPPERIVLNKNIKLGLLSEYFAKKLNKSWKASAKVFSSEDYIDFFNAYRQKNPPCMFLDGIDGVEVTKLLEACKKNNITVNEAIATAFISAFQQTDDERYVNNQIRFGSAASVRNELKEPAPGCMGNFVTGVAVTVHYDGDKSFTENAKNLASNLRKELLKPKSRYLVLNFLNLLDKEFIESAIFAAYGNYNNPASKKLGELLGERGYNKGIGISNLGKQKLDAYSNFAVSDIVFIPPAFPANQITIGVMTINNHMDFCLRYSISDMTDERAKKIYREALIRLSQL